MFARATPLPTSRDQAQWLRARGRRTEEGMTLIEIMIVIVIGALLVTGATMGIGAISRSNLRAGTMTISAAARFAYHRAVTHGKTVRIALDFGANTIALEEAHGNVVIADPNAEDNDDDELDEDDGSRDPWAAAQARLDDSFGANLGRASFSTISTETDEDGDGEVERTAIDRFLPRPFEGAQLHLLISPHEQEPREQGKGYIYFFPSGRAENAVVQLVNESDIVYSVELESLTGRPRIYSYAFGEEDMEERELRDPG